MKTFFSFSLVDDGCDHLCLNKPSVFNRFRSFHCYLSFSRQGMKQIFTTISSRFPEFHHPQPLNQWHLAMYHKVDLSLRRDETVVIKCFLIYHLKVPPKWFSTNELVKSTSTIIYQGKTRKICLPLSTLEYLITVLKAKSKGVIPFTCWAFKLILKALNWLITISSTTSNCPSMQAIWNRVFHYLRLIDTARLLDTLEYELGEHCSN